MNSSEEEKLAPITSDVIDNENKAERKKKRKYRFWIREIYKQRDKRFLFKEFLIRNLRLKKAEDFKSKEIVRIFLFQIDKTDETLRIF